MARLARLVSSVLNLPISGISLLDEDAVMVVASTGLPPRSTGPQPGLLCRSCAAGGDLLEIPDATTDRRLAADPLVSGSVHLTYYVGVPVKNRSGVVIATLWAGDTRTRALTPEQLSLLEELGADLSRILELTSSPVDELTGLPDLSYLLELTKLEARWCGHEGRSITVCVVEVETDLDDPSRPDMVGLDDTREPRAIGAALAECTWRIADIVARCSRTQFAVLLSGTDFDGAEAVCARMLDAIAGLELPKGSSAGALVGSIGSSTVTGPADPDALLAEALVSLAAAKAEGGDRHVGRTFPG